MEKLRDKTHFEELCNSSKKFWIFKNSTICPISEYAYKIANETIQDENIPYVYEIDVHQQPELKMHVADFLGVKHESPQMICIQDKKVLGHASHGDITKERILL